MKACLRFFKQVFFMSIKIGKETFSYPSAVYKDIYYKVILQLFTQRALHFLSSWRLWINYTIYTF